jgi:signal transduction histidine kinase
LEKEILGISEREQSRIGQDLHDGLCSIWLESSSDEVAGTKPRGKSKRESAEAAELAKLVRHAIEETRTLAHGLSPVMLARRPDERVAKIGCEHGKGV